MLWHASRQRLIHTIKELSPLVRIEIVAFFGIAAILIAVHASEGLFQGDPDEPEASAMTISSRLIFAGLLLAVTAIAQYAPRILQRAADDDFLRSRPVPSAAVSLWRADLLALSTLPIAVLGSGFHLPPLAFGEVLPTAIAVLAWWTWLVAGSYTVAVFVLAAPEERWGRFAAGRVLGRVAHFASIPMIAVLYYAMRETAIRWSDPSGVFSMVWTVAFGSLVAWAMRSVAGRVGRASQSVLQRLAERRAILAWKKRERARHHRGWTLYPWNRGAPNRVEAWIGKDLRLALRVRSLWGHWLAAISLKVLAFVLLAYSVEPLPWVTAGLLLLLGDLAAGVVLLLAWSRELAGWMWGSRSSRAEQWWARALPALGLSVAGSVALGIWAGIELGWHDAQPLTLWTGISGISLVVAAANLGVAAPPRSALGQNLYGLGLFSALLVGAVFPMVGWAVLAAFALYTTRALTRDPRP